MRQFFSVVWNNGITFVLFSTINKSSLFYIRSNVVTELNCCLQAGEYLSSGMLIAALKLLCDNLLRYNILDVVPTSSYPSAFRSFLGKDRKAPWL